MLGEAARAHDQATLQVAAGDQLLDQQTRHNRLAGTGVVGEQEAQRLARQHRFVDGGDLVRQRLDDRRMHRQHRIEQVRQADPVRLRDQTKLMPVAVEAPRPAFRGDLQTRLIVAVEQLVGELAGRVLVGQLDRTIGHRPQSPDNCAGCRAPTRSAAGLRACSYRSVGIVSLSGGDGSS